MKATKGYGGEENYPAFKEPLSISSCVHTEGCSINFVWTTGN